jgi:hypothetical protein
LTGADPVRHGRVVGVITRSDFFRSVAERLLDC